MVHVVAGLQRLLSFPSNSKLVLLLNHFCQAYVHMHKILLVVRGGVGTNENNIKTRVWTVLWTIIRKARNHYQDVDNCGDEDHCQYHLGIDHCQTGNRSG